jgi:hypothetical protein
MFMGAYLPNFFTVLFGVLLVFFVLFGIATFGNGLAFNRICIILLKFTEIVCRKDINVVSVVSVIIILILRMMWDLLA